MRPLMFPRPNQAQMSFLNSSPKTFPANRKFIRWRQLPTHCLIRHRNHPPPALIGHAVGVALKPATKIGSAGFAAKCFD